jgi:hypothetical protein
MGGLLAANDQLAPSSDWQLSRALPNRPLWEFRIEVAIAEAYVAAERGSV